MIENLRPMNNMVLVKLSRPANPDFYNTKSGIGIPVITNLNKQNYIVTTGDVVAVPDALNYDPLQPLLEYDVPLEVKVGDHVHFIYTAVGAAIQQGMWWKRKDGEYVLIRYDLLTLAIRNKTQRTRVGPDKVLENYWEVEFVGLNGFYLGDLVKDYSLLTRGEITVPEIAKSNFKFMLARIRTRGAMVKKYFLRPDKEADSGVVQEGDLVIFQAGKNVPLEYSVVQELKQGYARIMEKDIMAVVNDDGTIRVLPWRYRIRILSAEEKKAHPVQSLPPNSLPQATSKWNYNIGEVLQVAPEEANVKVGDHLVFQMGRGTNVVVDGKPWLILDAPFVQFVLPGGQAPNIVNKVA